MKACSRLVAALLLATATAPLVVAQELPGATPAESGRADAASVAAPRARPPLFTAEEMERFRQIAAAREAAHASYIRKAAADVDEDVVLLEPYIVEGDDSLLLARIRRALESGYSARGRSFIGLSTATQVDLVRARFREDAFFRGRNPGAPEDALTGGVDLLALPFIFADAVRQKSVVNLFRAPPGAAGDGAETN